MSHRDLAGRVVRYSPDLGLVMLCAGQWFRVRRYPGRVPAAGDINFPWLVFLMGASEWGFGWPRSGLPSRRLDPGNKYRDDR